MQINHPKYYPYLFCRCAFFAIIFILISGCHGDNKPNISHFKRIDFEKNPYQFSPQSFVPQDIQALKKNNLDLKTARIRIKQSQALYTQAFAGYLPQLTAGFSANKQFNNSQGGGQNAFVLGPQGDTVFYSFNAQLSLVPDIWGRTRLRTQSADNQIQASYLQEQSTYLQILNGYIKNYNLVCSTKLLRDIHKNMVTLNQNLADSVQIRYKLGRTNIVDYYNAQDSLMASNNDLNKAQQNYNLALQGYYSLIGESIKGKTGETLCDNGFSDLPRNDININLQNLDNRPDIQAIQYRLRAAYNNVDLSLRAIYPDISVLFKIQSFSDSVSNILDIDGFIKNFIGQISQTIYDGGVRDAQIDISQSEADLLKQTYMNTLKTAGNELITLGKNFELAVNLKNQSQSRVQISQNALSAATRNYKLGNINFLDLQNSQRNYYIAQLELALNKQTMRNLYADILTASGIAPIETE
jgi:outer membrane protein TolC